eukprot:249054-Chlamydomonas_euryale.AAC.6
MHTQVLMRFDNVPVCVSTCSLHGMTTCMLDHWQSAWAKALCRSNGPSICLPTNMHMTHHDKGTAMDVPGSGLRLDRSLAAMAQTAFRTHSGPPNEGDPVVFTNGRRRRQGRGIDAEKVPDLKTGKVGGHTAQTAWSVALAAPGALRPIRSNTLGFIFYLRPGFACAAYDRRAGAAFDLGASACLVDS